MSLRSNRRLRGLARRLPLIRAYEKRIAALTAQVGEISGATGDGAPMWVPPGHFYSPIPALSDLRAREQQIFGRDPTDVPGIDLRLDAQRSLLDALEPLQEGVSFPRTEVEARAACARFWSDNIPFGSGDALFLTLLLRHLRPRRLIELGCGFSSACTLDARDRYLDGVLDVTFVDPYPQLLESLVRERDRSSARVLTMATQDVPLDVVRELEAGDVLFVDSTHVCRTGSDVNRIVFELLPALAPGVVVHFHDMFPGFEYPAPWVFEGRSWTELYLVRAFLQYNDSFEIMLWPNLLAMLDHHEVVRRFPLAGANIGGSLWLRKVK
ncbi:MAG: class I SAM-dependent methyltransferase [Acidimicrobiia bacterium]